MALIDRILLRGPEETARAESKREFRRVFRTRGLLEEKGLTDYYDHRYGRYGKDRDNWEEGNANIFKANPELRRIDIVADFMFANGVFVLSGMGDVVSPRNVVEGCIAAVKLRNTSRSLSGMLTLDIGGEARFTKLRIGNFLTNGVFTIRPSSLDRGIVIEPDEEEKVRRELPISVSDRSQKPIGIFQTVAEAVDALRQVIGNY
jgi:hypothetical protein